MIITILGAPGSGKGTQANLLAEKLGVRSISVGELLRKEVQENTKYGKTANEYMIQGKWVPSSITIEVLKKELENIDLKKGVVIDAFPRLLEEKALLDNYLKSKGYRLDFVFNLIVNDEECLNRIRNRRNQKGAKQTIRKDESDEITKKRISLHHETVKEILQTFKKEKLLHNIDGNRGIGEIQADMYEIITNFNKY